MASKPAAPSPSAPAPHSVQAGLLSPSTNTKTPFQTQTTPSSARAYPTPLHTPPHRILHPYSSPVSVTMTQSQAPSPARRNSPPNPMSAAAPAIVVSEAAAAAAASDLTAATDDVFVPPPQRGRSKSIASYEPVSSRFRDSTELHAEAAAAATAAAAARASAANGNGNGNGAPKDLASIWSRVQPANHHDEGSAPAAAAAPPAVAPRQFPSTTPRSSFSGNLPRRPSTGSHLGPWEGFSRNEPRRPSNASASPFLNPDYDPVALSGGSPPSRSRQSSFEPAPGPRRHSVAAGNVYVPPGRSLSQAVANLALNDDKSGAAGPGGFNALMEEIDDYYGGSHAGTVPPARRPSGTGASLLAPPMPAPLGAGSGFNPGRRASTGQVPTRMLNAAAAAAAASSSQAAGSLADVGRGIPLHVLPSDTPLFIVEFKSGRSDLFYYIGGDAQDEHITAGDLVIVEADRGKDLGKVIRTSITPHQIHLLQAQQSPALADVHRVNREIHPKRIFRLAAPQEVHMLATKGMDEYKALAVCQTKVRQKKYPMEVVDAEYQWDRRKLTFYFVSDTRIDFRELVRDLFKIYKTRIWMCAVSAIGKAPAIVRGNGADDAGLGLAKRVARGDSPLEDGELSDGNGNNDKSSPLLPMDAPRHANGGAAHEPVPAAV
ncbi:hypothetical protein H9P43_002957 [Blastocladiella emersonii ATCC 22665]|nr:hypothetical protein H9P43_002957 [Blastocladiella emersonii ATCC 22665]